MSQQSVREKTSSLAAVACVFRSPVAQLPEYVGQLAGDSDLLQAAA